MQIYKLFYEIWFLKMEMRGEMSVWEGLSWLFTKRRLLYIFCKANHFKNILIS